MKNFSKGGKSCIVYFSLLLSGVSVNACPQIQKQAAVDEVKPNAIEILSIERVVNKNDPEVMAGICTNFVLSKEDVQKFFQIADPVDGITIHYEAIILPCQYQGKLNLKGQTLNWQIIAGGSGAWYNEQGVDQDFLCRDTTCCSQFNTLC